MLSKIRSINVVGVIVLVQTMACVSVHERWLREGDDALAAHDYSRAAELYDAAARGLKNPSVLAARWKRLADSYAAIGNSETEQLAHRFYKYAVKSDPKVVGARLGRAKLLLARPEADEATLDHAIRLLNEEANLQPDNKEIATLLTQAADERTRTQQANRDRDDARRMAAEQDADGALRAWQGEDVVRAEPQESGETPPTRATVSGPQAVGDLRCEVPEFRVVLAPDPIAPASSITAVRLRCTNTSKKQARLARTDVHLIDANGEQFEPDKSDANLQTVFEEPAPTYGQHFIDFKPKETADVGFTFEATYDRSVDQALQLDVRGVRFAQGSGSQASSQDGGAERRAKERWWGDHPGGAQPWQR